MNRVKLKRALPFLLALTPIATANVSWKPLWDGKSFAGWHIDGPANLWKVENDPALPGNAIHGSMTSGNDPYTMFFSDVKFDQFTIRVKYKVTRGNSGYFIRSVETPTGYYVHGLQVEVDAERDAGSLYCTDCGEWKFNIDPAVYNQITNKTGWNTLIVTYKGTTVYTNINGHNVAAWNSFGTTYLDKPGPIGLQMHGGSNADVWFGPMELMQGCTDKANSNYAKEADSSRYYVASNPSDCASTGLNRGQGIASAGSAADGTDISRGMEGSYRNLLGRVPADWRPGRLHLSVITDGTRIITRRNGAATLPGRN
jgi:hypothetical protein